MRLKQRFIIFLLPCIVSAMAAAAEPQLTQVGVASQGSATTVTLRATGAFTHTEYRPTDNLLLVDMAGVSAAKMDGKTHIVHAPGVVSYRVLGYKSSDGSNVARVELTLPAGSDVKLSEGANLLSVQIAAASSASAPATASAPALVEAASAAPVGESAPTHAENAARPIRIEKVGVVHGKDGVALEILASAPFTPQTTKLSGPDRLVLDVPNAIAATHFKPLAVNSGAIKGVRMGRFQQNPPVTRIVVDLNQDHDFELAPDGSKLLVKFHEVAAATQAAAPVPAPVSSEPAAAASNAPATEPAAAVTPAPAQSAPPVVSAEADAPQTAPAAAAGKAADFAVVNAEMKPVAPAQDPVAKAGDAASHFTQAAKSDSFDVSQTPSASLHPLANPNLAFQQTGSMPAAGTAARPKYTGEPISVNLKDVDLKDFFRLIHEISGLNVVLDPNVHGTLTIVLDDVPWDQALDIVLKNNGMDRQLEGNVLRIATVETLKKEADARRGQIEAQALAVDKVTVVRFLSYAHSKDVVPVIKRFLSARGDVVADDRTNSLIIDDIPNSIPKVDELIAKLDRKTAEVEIEARVVAATRNFSREIGTQLGFGWGINSTTTTGGNSDVGHSNTGVQFPVPAGSPAGATGVNYPTVAGGGAGTTIPLFSNLPVTGPTSGLTLVNATRNFRLDFQLSLLESRGLLKILSRPRVVTQNNIQALVRQGVRVPVTTQAQLGGPPTVTYVDAFLRLSVTPQITAENTIFLNVDVENTTPDFSRTIQGNPTLITQQATTQVLVTDGGTVVIGGVIQTTNSINIQQVPLLGNIPGLGSLFRHKAVSTQTQELIFFITPRIIQT